ncbi:hypothetical protein JOM56_007207 [Amanita muscaria]
MPTIHPAVEPFPVEDSLHRSSRTRRRALNDEELTAPLCTGRNTSNHEGGLTADASNAPESPGNARRDVVNLFDDSAEEGGDEADEFMGLLEFIVSSPNISSDEEELTEEKASFTLSGLPQTNDRFQELLLEARAKGWAFSPAPLSRAPGSTNAASGGGTEAVRTSQGPRVEANAVLVTSALAITVKPSSAGIVQSISILQVPAEPNVLDLINIFLEADLPATRRVKAALLNVDQPAATVFTALELLNKSECFDEGCDWELGYRVLGSWQELQSEAEPPKIARCRTSERRTKALAAHAPDALESIPVYFLGIIEEPNLIQQPSLEAPTPGVSQEALMEEGSSTSVCSAGTLMKAAGESGSGEKDNAACEYLETTIDSRHFATVNQHVRSQAGNSCAAYAHLIFARIIEENCTRFHIPYKARCNQRTKVSSAHGAAICMNDIVCTFNFVAPTTFSNHQSLHLRAQSAVGLLEGGAPGLKAIDREYVQKLKILLETNLACLDVRKFSPSSLGSLAELTRRLKAALDAGGSVAN